ncbi:MAG: homoserine kinase [Rhodothermales bacterium]
MRTACTALAPASLSNLGPGYDCLGMAIEGWGDRVSAERQSEPGVVVDHAPDSIWTGPSAPDMNTAAVAAAHVLNACGSLHGVRLTIRKGIRAGTGLGSSASSAVAGALAAAGLMGLESEHALVLEAALAGEAVASGARHGDNVLPCLLGGTVLSHSDNPFVYERLNPGYDLHFAVLLPDVEVTTRSARSELPASIPLAHAVRHASRLAMLVQALTAGSPESFGKAIMEDALIEPVRARMLPFFGTVKQRALSEGAFGCALSGSGPSMFAVCRDPAHAAGVAQAMLGAAREMGADGHVRVSRPDERGARLEGP